MSLRKVVSSIRKAIIKLVTPLRDNHVKEIRNKLKETEFTLLCNNCLGGVIYHDLGQPFSSPTINLYLNISDFLTLVEHIEDFIDAELVHEDSWLNFPVGRLYAVNSDVIVVIYFMHYKTWDDAYSAWMRRMRRVDTKKIFVLVDAVSGLSNENYNRFCNIKYHKHLLVPYKTATVPHDAVDVHFMKSYKDEDNSGKSMSYTFHGMGIKRYIEEWDYLNWLNESSN